MDYKLIGLDCAECASKIEDKLNKLYPDAKVVVDFANQKIVGEKELTKEQILEVSSKIEPDLEIADETSNYKYKLLNLDCASCAQKIEDKLNKMPEVNKATVNFANSTLNIEYDEKDFDKIIKQAKIVEPDVIISKDIEPIKKDNQPTKGISKDDINKELLISIIVSLLILASTFIIPLSENMKLAFYFVAYIVAGYDILIKLVKNLINGQVLDENFLMGIATVAAFAIGEHLEAIAIMVFYKVGEFFQDLAVNRSRKSITTLMDIRPDYANLVHGDNIETVSPESVSIGDIIIVKPGEKVPLDGQVIEGESYLDTKALTGESKEVKVNVGKEILSGSVNKNGLLKIKVTKAFKESTVSKILDLVENASSNKAPTENFISKFARIYTPVVVGIAILVALIPPLVTKQPFDTWIYRALIFLVISCPCALVISIPLSFFGGIGNASRHGILIKGANYLEALVNAETIAFDKTGTITKGEFEVEKVVPENNFTTQDIIEKTAYVQMYSSHPIATSIKNYYHQQLDSTRISEYEDIAGHGVKAKVDGLEILAGNAKMMNKFNIKFNPVNVTSTIVYVAINNQYAGYILIGDIIKPEAKQAMSDLKNIGFKHQIMLSGDNEAIANEVAKEVGIETVHAQLLPDQKVTDLEQIISNKPEHTKVAYVGDGINDAPVLARADIGIAMGGVGSDAAIEAADIVIMNDDLEKIVTSKKIALKTRKIVTQNITLAIVVKLACLLLGVLGMAAVWEAVIADVGVALVAILNATRVLNDKHID